MMIRRLCCLLALSLMCIASSCVPDAIAPASRSAAARSGAGTMEPIVLDNTVRPVSGNQGIALHAARNEWTSFALRVGDLSAGSYWIRIHEPQLQTANKSIALGNFEASQVLSMPIDLDRAGFVRHTGLSTASHEAPRALIPAPLDSNGTLNLDSLRHPNPSAATEGVEPLMVWIDLHVPTDSAPGDYITTIDLMHEGQDRPIVSTPLSLQVYNFALPEERHLDMVGEIPWDRLKVIYADRFEAVTPRLVNRGDKRYADTVRTLDQLVLLAERNRTTVVIPQLQPTVKWDNPDAPPSVDWRDFDTLVAPWFSGAAFPDHQGVAYWPLPAAENLEQYDRKSRLDYWDDAARHFDQNDWLNKTAISVHKVTPGRAGAQDTIELSADAAEILTKHPRVHVMLPLEDSQIQFANPHNEKLIDPSTASRLMVSVPGLVFATPADASWPVGIAPPEHWLRTDLPGVVPFVGAGGDERDVRVWAWLAFLRHAHYVLWDSVLPTVTSPTEPGDPNQLVWFYPGEWFGLHEPVPTVQLKWLRRAQQDYEYLWLAQQRGEVINALQMARLITKLVEIQPGQAPDPTYSLMSGTTDQKAWDDAQRLLAQTILLRQPGEKVDDAKQRDLYIQTLQWASPKERPLLLGRTAEWSWDAAPGAADRMLKLRVGVDIYNASDGTPGGNKLNWGAMPPDSGWEIHPSQPIQIPKLETYRVLRATLDARFDATKLTPAARRPVQVTFTDGFTKIESPLQMVLPVASCERREGRLAIDGALDDWDRVDALQDGPMVTMLSRPAIQQQSLQFASTRSRIYSGWTNDNFYVAFALNGLAPEALHKTQNFIDYKDRRAWGEDLCEVLIQPVYGDALNSLGPVLHVVCKPNGAQWVERKSDPHENFNLWQAVESSGIRYAATTPDGGKWNGEVAIPWKMIGDEHRGLPVLIRFNFIQHRTSTGESASWCGPIDFGRDDQLMGVLYLKEPGAPDGSNIVISPPSSNSPGHGS